MTAAEHEAAIAGAIAVQQDGDAYLRLLERDDQVAAFAQRWEAVGAQVEGRLVRTQLHCGPLQPSCTPMSNEQFVKMFARVQCVLEGG